ncbi:MAG: two-component regulator propeller domain-containing protein [Bacteroidales bacterium]|nr:two-component regulator propeller domain-containing protein [Bacteroidales bacterium]
MTNNTAEHKDWLTDDSRMKAFHTLLLLLLSSITQAQTPYRFRHYGREEGLSNLNVNCAMQDSRGLVWVGTNIGLNRFDGIRFHTYFASNGQDVHSLPSNTINSLAEGAEGRLWIGTTNGLCSFDPEQERFERVEATELSGGVIGLLTDPKGRLWARTEQHLVCYHPTDGTVKTYDMNSSMCVGRNGIVWMCGYDGHLYRYDDLGDKFVGFDVLTKEQVEGSEWLNAVVELSDGDLALLTNHLHGYRFSPATGQKCDLFAAGFPSKPYFLHTAIERPASDGSPTLWMGTEEGIVVYNLRTGESVNMRKHFSDPYSLSDNAVHVLFSDREGGVWAGTFFGGMNYVPDEREEMFRVWQPVDASGTAMAKVVREMAVDAQGQLWVGTEDGGVFLYKDGLQKVDLTWQGKTITRNIQTLMTDGTDLWLGTYDEGIYIVDTRTAQVTSHLGSGRAGLHTNTFVHLERSHDGRILAGTMHLGLLIYDRTTHTFSTYEGKGQGFIHDIYEDSRGRLWVADLVGGIFRADKIGAPLKRLCPDIKNATTVFEDSQRRMWVGSSSNGLYTIDADGRSSQPLPELARSGIGIDKLSEDGNGRLWISTTDGLYCYDDTAVSRYGSDNGLPTEQFNFNSGLRDSTGRFYFGTLNGLVSFVPSSSMAKSQKLHVLFTGLFVEGREVTRQSDPDILKQSLLYADEIHLRHDQTSLSIDFACPLYSVPQAIWYRYRLEGIESEWTVTKGAQRLTLAGLSPGTYTLVVQASRENGRWDDETEASRLRIVVHRPWWASTPMLLLYLLLACVLGWYIYRAATRRRREKRRIANERTENERYRDVLQSKIQFFTTITHEIRTPLSLIMGSIERMEAEAQHPSQLSTLRRNAQRLLNLVNQLLDFRKIESSQFLLNFLPTDVTSLLREVCADFTPAAHQKAMRYDIDLPEGSGPSVMADREALTKIVSNLLSNAMKFGERHVGVALREEGGHVRIMVENDGPRIPHDQLDDIFKPFYQYYGTQVNATVKGSGLGLPLARSLAEMMNGTLTYDERQHERNCFVLTLPKTETTPINTVLPLSGEDGEDSGAALPLGADRGGAEGPAILIVDDEQELREFICEELTAHYRILQAENGQQALDILQQENVQLIVTDVMMPVMNGIELCKRVKTDTRYCHIPIVVLTAKVSLQDHLDALTSQADAYIEKPFSSAQLKAQIDNLIRGRQLLRSSMLSSPYANVTTVASNTFDENLLEQLNSIVEKHLDDPQLTVELLAEHMNMSTSTLYRKVKGVTSLSPNDFIRLCRLKKAAEMLGSGRYRIKEVSARTGFSSVAYFTSCFMRQFGLTPGAFMKKKD